MLEQFLIALAGLVAVIVLFVGGIVIVYPSAPVRDFMRQMSGKRREKPRRIGEDPPALD